MDARTLENRYGQVLQEAQSLRGQVCRLEQDVRESGPELYRAYLKIDRLEQRNEKLAAENKAIKGKLADLTAQLKQKPRPPPPAFVKANAVEKPVKKPGRRKGHKAALRPMPRKIDAHETPALPIDTLGKTCCPECRAQLSEVRHHERYVEVIFPTPDWRASVPHRG